MHAICHKAGLWHAIYSTSTQLFLPKCMPSAIWQVVGMQFIHPISTAPSLQKNVTYSNSQLTEPTVFKLNAI